MFSPNELSILRIPTEEGLSSIGKRIEQKCAHEVLKRVDYDSAHNIMLPLKAESNNTTNTIDEMYPRITFPKPPPS